LLAAQDKVANQVTQERQTAEVEQDKEEHPVDVGAQLEAELPAKVITVAQA
jgi:hypothetical protein